MIANYIYKL